MGKWLFKGIGIVSLLLIGSLLDAALKNAEEARQAAYQAQWEAERTRRQCYYDSNRAWYDKLWDGG